VLRQRRTADQLVVPWAAAAGNDVNRSTQPRAQDLQLLDKPQVHPLLPLAPGSVFGEPPRLALASELGGLEVLRQLRIHHPSPFPRGHPITTHAVISPMALARRSHTSNRRLGGRPSQTSLTSPMSAAITTPQPGPTKKLAIAASPKDQKK